MKSKLSIVTLVLVCFFACLVAGCKQDPPPAKLFSQGSRVGTVQKFSFKGMEDANKTWEGELKMNAGEAPWPFSVDPADAAVAEEVHQAQLSGKRVELVYEQWKNYGTSSARTFETEYHVKKVNYP